MFFTRRHLLLGAATVAATLAASSFGAPLFAKGSAPAKPATPTPPKPKDVIETLTASTDPSFKTFLDALKAADVTSAFKAHGPITVFAPTDDAFKKLPEGKLAELMKPENKAQLKALLEDQIVSGKQMAADIAKVKSLKTAGGHNLDVKVADDKSWTIADVKPTKTDVAAANGVIHYVEGVLMPKVDAAKPEPTDPKKTPPK